MEPIRVLLVEDSEDDALLVLRALRKGGYEVSHRRVDTRPAMQSALNEAAWDIVLSDFDMPMFDGLQALECLNGFGGDLPFIMVSGKIGEETAAEVMRRGAKDFVGKHNLSRLVPAVRRELTDAESRRQRQEAESRLAVSEARYAAIFKGAEVGIWEEDFSDCVAALEGLRAQGVTDLGRHLQARPDLLQALAAKVRIIDVNPATLRMLGAQDRRQLQSRLSQVFLPASLETFRAELVAIWDGRDRFQAESVHKSLDGRTIDVLISMPIPADPDGFRHVPVSVLDISQRKRAEESLQRANRALRTLSASNHTLLRLSDEQRLLEEVCQTVVAVGGYRMAWVGRREEDGTVRPLASQGEAPGFLSAARTLWKPEPGCPVGQAIGSGRHRVVQAIATLTADTPWRAAALERGYQAAAVFPLRVVDSVFGALTIFSEHADGFDSQEIELLEELADDLAFGLEVLHVRREREQDRKQLEENLVKTIRMLSLAVEKRDPYTAGHQQRVAALASAIAKAMGFDADRAKGIYLGGLIHDIGKLYIPAEILSRPAQLSDVEFLLIQSHSLAGFEIMSGLDFPWPLAEMVRDHHERLDGSGYPNGLRGDAISIEARILAVADVVEAIASYRPYRPALGLDAALAEIEANAGPLYDPEVVAVCCGLFRDDGFTFQ